MSNDLRYVTVIAAIRDRGLIDGWYYSMSDEEFDIIVTDLAWLEDAREQNALETAQARKAMREIEGITEEVLGSRT